VPGDRLICTVPLFYEDHEQPFDFFRYAQFAHRCLFTQAGFEVERIEWPEGFFGMCGYVFQLVFRYLPAKFQGALPIAFLATPFLVIVRRSLFLRRQCFTGSIFIARLRSSDFRKTA
jgi:hypothetical protein